jgi:tryptophan synthase alpha subunit
VQERTYPVAVGFGINTPKHVKTVIRFGAQAAIVGSGIVDAIFKGEDFTGYVRSLKDAAEDS